MMEIRELIEIAREEAIRNLRWRPRQLLHYVLPTKVICRKLTKRDIRRLMCLGYRIDIRGGMIPEFMSDVSNSLHISSLKELYLAQIDLSRKLLKLIDEASYDDRDRKYGRHYGIFQPFVDEERLGKCLWDLFVMFFGVEPKAQLRGKDCDVLTFVAYLFILMEHEHLGGPTFSEKGRKPFYEFVMKEAIPSLSSSQRRTFHNRLNIRLNVFRSRMQQESRDSLFLADYWKRNVLLNDFLLIRDHFRQMDYYNELKTHF